MDQKALRKIFLLILGKKHITIIVMSCSDTYNFFKPLLVNKHNNKIYLFIRALIHNAQRLQNVRIL